jgi:RND family efflux transporter MFP subunit
MKPLKLRYGKWLLSVAFVAILIGLGLLWSNKGATPVAHGSPKGEHQSTSEPVAVKVIKPQTGGLERSATVPGCSLEAFDYENIYAKVPGYLIKQKVDIGSVVKKGEILAEIDAPELIQDELHAVAALDQAKSQVQQMAAHVNAANAELEAAKILIDQRKSELKRAKSNLDFRQIRYDRYKKLVDQRALDQNTLDEQFEQREAAHAWCDAAAASVSTAVADVEAKKAKVLQAEADLEAARANVKVADATLARAHVFVAYTKIRSKYNGRVTYRGYHNGDYIKAGNDWEPLFTVRRMELMRLVIWLPDADSPFCREPGDPVDFTVKTMPHLKLPTYSVSRVSRSQDQKTKAMRIEVDVPNDKGLLDDGLYGDVTIHFKHFQEAQKELFKNAVHLPSSALARDGDKVLAYVVKDHHVHAVPVQVGTDNGNVAEILSGLNPDDEVVNSPTALLRDGMEVRVIQDHPEQVAVADHH